MSNPSLLSPLFLGLLTLHLFVTLWLEARQRKHVTLLEAVVPNDFQTEVSASEHSAAARYTVDKSRLSSWSAIYQFAETLFWIFGGGLVGLHALINRWMGEGMWADLTFVASFALIHALIQTPMSLYATFVVEARHGFNRTRLGLWASDQLKGFVIGLLLGLPILATMLELMSQAGPHWWAWAWVIWMAFQLLLMVIAPRFLLPLFNTFRPFEDQDIRPRAEALMHAVGFKAKDFQIMDASRRSSHSNAFFTGLGSEKRVIFFDTLLDKLNAGEVIAVLAHELGHFKLKHVAWMFVSQAFFSALFFYAIHLLRLNSFWLEPLGLQVSAGFSSDAMLLLALYWLLPPVLFFIKPLTSAKSRQREFEADAFAIRHAKASDLRHALIKLYKGNASTLTPDPIYVWFHHSHPPALDRLMKLNG